MSPSPTESPLESPYLPPKPLDELKEVVQTATSALQPSDDVETDEQVIQNVNGNAQRTKEFVPPKTASISNPPAALASKVEPELPPIPETMVPIPPILPSEPEQKKAVSGQPVEKTRDVEKDAKLQDAEKVKKRQNALTRTIWTFIMIGGFLGTHLTPALLCMLTY